MRRLDAVGMGGGDIAKVTIFLADRKYREANFEVRCEVLRSHCPAVML